MTILKYDPFSANNNAIKQISGAGQGAGGPNAYSDRAFLVSLINDLVDQINDGSGGNSGLTLLASETIISPVANIVIPFSGDYLFFKFQMMGWVTDGGPSTYFAIRYSSDGGSTFYGDGDTNFYTDGADGIDVLQTVEIKNYQIGGDANVSMFVGNDDSPPSGMTTNLGLSVALLRFTAVSVVVVDGGSGYSINDKPIVSLNADVGNSGQIVVDTVSGGGAILTAHIYATNPPRTFSATDETNPTGLDGGGTVNLTWTNNIIVPVNAFKVFCDDGSNLIGGVYALWGVG